MKDFFRNYWLVSRDFWRSKAGLVALLILVVCVLFEFTSVGLSVYLNHWYVAFYNAVEQYDKQTLLQQLLIFAAITSAMLLNSFLSYFCGQYLIIFMRKPMTENYVSNWLNSKSYLSCTTIYDNPEERISYDIQQLIMLSKNMFLTIIHSVSTLVSFSIILWGLSGVLSLSLYGYEFNIYGYLFWVAIALGIINVWAVFRVGKPLKELLNSQQKYEADFRYGLSVVRNNKNSIYDNQSEKREYVLSRKNFNRVVDNFYKLTFRKAKIDIVRSFFVQIYSLTGTILALPRYFAKSISFGQIMQVQSAFYSVISPMLFLVFWYENLAELRTNVSRLSELKKSMHTSQLQDNTRIINSQQQALITLENVTITKQDGVLLENISFSLTKGEGLFIHGRIGIGKTSLLRVINGHSDNFIGKITLNKIPKILFLSQRPYFPEDDFKRAVFYPFFANIPTDDEFKQILGFLGIGYLAKFINSIHEWRNILSCGEQQKLRLCKIFTKAYDLILLDEATSNIDAKSEKKIYQLLKDKGLAYISVSHNDRVKAYHDKVIELTSD
ncbi:ABC transporter ATP-binding protein/permease [Francisella tularensis]|uniref:ABC transporter ATP-binding protein/permease n=1 Tax=Francisella tularensis TaxID=263 RepID=UPI0008F55231|nr:SbmA/BacA-like family transporter [Francisella tularensis]APA83885.1 ABC transporter ATP-binding protein [Francisella tularensis subsp. novicida PA10-7858]